MAKVLVACEFSGVVRDAFEDKGHEALSCDLLPDDSETFGDHYQGDLFDVIHYPWDLIIYHPPCTDLAVSGARWFRDKQYKGLTYAGASFFMRLVKARPDVPSCIENPVGVMSNLYRKPDQIIQPWQFGHGETKATCLWLNHLPCLKPTNVVEGRESRIHRMSPGRDRGKQRSITYQGIADAMADQWGSWI